MSQSQHSSNFTFSAEPRALGATKTIRAPLHPTTTTTTSSSSSTDAPLKRTSRYRERASEEFKESTLSLMSDPRVIRGTNYSARPAAFRNPAANPLPIPPPTTQSSHLPFAVRDQSTLPTSYSSLPPSSHPPHPTKPPPRKPRSSPLYIRPVTPPPLPNRLHLSTQTDPLYHDLRSSAYPAPTPTTQTQTDASLDVDTPPLFVWRSSGVDVGTEMEGREGLFDFERDVSAVVEVMVERAMVDGVREVVEEEEEREVTRWRAEWEHKLQGEVMHVQRMQQRDQRMHKEREERTLQREARRVAEADAARRRADAVRREREGREAEERARKAAEDAKPDPIAVEVSQLFLPWLLSDVQRRLAVDHSAQQALHSLVHAALAHEQARVVEDRRRRRQAEFDAYVDARYEGRAVPPPSVMSTVEDDAYARRVLLHALHGRPVREAAPPSAEAEAQRRIRLREEEVARKAKYLRDVVRVQSQWRARKARRRVRALRDRRDLVERRKTMQPRELLATLHARLGVEVAWMDKEESKQPDPVIPAADVLVLLSSDAAANTTTTGSRPTTAAASAPSPSTASTAASRPQTSAVAEAPVRGVLVTAVDVRGPAVQASILPLDVLVHVGGEVVGSMERWEEMLGRVVPGDLVQVGVWRHVTGRVDVVVMEAASDEPEEWGVEVVRGLRREAGGMKVGEGWVGSEEARAAVEAAGGKPGFTVAKRTGKVKEGGGVVVGKVSAGSGAERAGLREGDVVMRVGREEVKGVEEFKEMSGAWQAGEVVVLDVRRGEGEAAVDVKVRVEVGAATAPKRNSVEFIRSMRRLAGMKHAKD